MISAKRIHIIAAVLMLAALLFVFGAMWYADPAGHVQQEGSITYADGCTVVYTADDYDGSYQEERYSTITLTGNSAVTNSAKVLISGSEITILGGGTYVISGALTDGSITVNSSENSAVRLVLDNASIASSDFSAIYVEQAEAVIITLAEGSVNELSDGAQYDTARQEEGKPDAALYCRDNLTINGTGALYVAGNYQDGIKCNDTLKLMSGTICVTAKDDGIRANDCLAVLSAKVEVTSEGDALHSDGDLVLSQSDCIISTGDDAVYAEKTVVLEPESLQIIKSREGIEGAYVIINSGDIVVTSSDDGINAVGENGSSGMMMPMGGQRKITEENTYLQINGGSLLIKTAGDGVDSNGAAVMNGGTVVVYGPENNGNSSLDFEYGFAVNGGTLLAAGSSGMAELPDSQSAQNVLVYYLDTTYAAGSTISVKNAAGETIVSGVSGKKFNWVCVSADTVQQGDTYTLYVNETETTALVCSGTVSSSGAKSGTGMMGTMPAMGSQGRRTWR